MQTIALTDFWIDRPYISNTSNFSILSDKYCNLNSCHLGNSKAYYYSGLVDKYQLKCVVIDDTFYLDFSANSITDVIKQQMWILKHTKGIEYKIEFVCLWEMFKLPTVEQLNEFAKIKEEVVVPIPTVQAQYEHAVNEMRLSTGLAEGLVLHNMHLSLSEYVDLMVSMEHSRLNAASTRHYATIIHNYHNPVVEEVAEVRQTQSSDEDLYNESLQILVEVSGMNEPSILPEDNESLNTYITSINQLVDEDQDISFEDVTRHATIVYNYHRSTRPVVEEVIDNPF